MLTPLALGWATADAWGLDPDRRPASAAGATAATPLRTVGAVAFSQDQYLAIQGSPQCDADGNVFLLPLPIADQRHLKRSRGPLGDPCPTVVLGVRADGRKTALLDPSTLPPFAEEDGITTLSIALDPGGAMVLLVWVPRGAGPRPFSEAGRQYIVSYDRLGNPRAPVELDPREISAGQIEVFGSGEVLLLGRRTQWDGERVAVLSAWGGLRDVVGLPIEVFAEPKARPRADVDHVARADDGRIYFASSERDSVHVIEASGASRHAFDLEPMPRTERLVGLKTAGPRLAVTYYEPAPDPESRSGGRYWIAVYNRAQGERVATYGPVPGRPLCYTYGDAGDRFTVIRDANQLVTLAP